MKKILLVRLLFSTCICLFGAITYLSSFITNVEGFSMSNGSISLQGQINTSTENDLQTAKNTYRNQHQASNENESLAVIENQGFFSYQKSADFMTISISPALIDFGQLSASNPVTRNTNISIDYGNNPYQVYAFEDSPLKSSGNYIIPDTTCDNSDCDDQTPAIWTNTFTYGFGYRCDNLQQGLICDSGFEPGYFKQFADILDKQDQSVIMQDTYPYLKQIEETQITYKVNVSGTQQPGNYQNTVTYILVPSF
jgi:hypothetical protein